MFHRSSLTLSATIQAELAQRGATSGYKMAMQYYAALQLVLAGIEYVPYDLEQTRKALQRDGQWYADIRRQFVDCQRVTFNIRHVRISCVRLEVQWFRKDENRPCAEFTLIVDEEGVPVESGITTSDERH